MGSEKKAMSVLTGGYDRVVYLPGVFDLFHVGHLMAIQKARKFGDYLIVGIQSDESVLAQKKKRPVFSEENRKRILFNVKGVDLVIVYNQPYQGEVLRVLKPSFLAVNETYGESDPDQKKTLEEAAKLNVAIARIDYMHGISTTAIQEQIRCT